MKVTNVYRPQIKVMVPDTTTAFLEFDSTFHPPGLEMEMAPIITYANGLIVHIDLNEDGRKIVQRSVRFSDHTGLEQEFTDGTSVTILSSLLQTMVNTIGAAEAAKDSTNPMYPNAYQRSQVVNKSYTPSLS